MPAVSKITTADYLSVAKVTPAGFAETTLGAALAAGRNGVRAFKYASGARVLSQANNASGSSGSATTPRIFYVPFLFPGLVVSGLAMYVNTGQTQMARLGVYAPHPTTGMPDQLLAALTAELNLSGALGERTGSFSGNITLPDTPVWVACATGTAGTPATVYVGAATAAWQHLLPSKGWAEHITSTYYKGYTATPAAYGALAATADLTSLAFTGSSVGILTALVVA